MNNRTSLLFIFFFASLSFCLAPKLPLSDTMSYFHLRFELSTTAKGTRLTALDTKSILTGRIIGTTGNPFKANQTLRSLVVAPKGSGKEVSIIADYAISPDAISTPIKYLFEKAGSGRSRLSIYDVDQGNNLIAEVVHQGKDSLYFELDLSKLKNAEPLVSNLPKFELPRMIWAFYYQWYWHDGWNKEQFQDQPLLGYYGSNEQSIIEKQIEQAKSAGIDGFVASWWGPDNDIDKNFGLLLDVAQDLKFKVMIYFETVDFDQKTWKSTPRDSVIIFKWLRYVISKYGDHPAYMKVNGKPVIVIYSSPQVPDITWQKVFKKLKEKGDNATYLAEFWGDSPDLSNLEIFDGLHTYNILSIVQSNDKVPSILSQTYEAIGRGVHNYPLLSDSGASKIWVATVEPGYDDHLIQGRKSPTLKRDDGKLYRATFDAALKSNPDWIFITTWNEWPEHTYIEPSKNFGNLFLDITREYADKWK